MSDRCERFAPLLSAWVDGELRAEERARLGQHVAACPRCRAEITTLRITKNLLASMPVRELPEGAYAALSGRDRRMSRHLSARRVATRALAGVGAAAITLVAAAFAAGGPSDSNTVPVPVDVYVAQHLVRSVGGPVSTPVIVDQP